MHGANKYGVFYDGEKNVQAHRFSYEINISEIPKGMVVMHSCDNPKCVNPDHLSVGTQLQNIHDAIKKKRLHPILNGDLSKISGPRVRGYKIKYERNDLGKRTKCNNGHDISSPDSVYINKNKPSTGRICRICKKQTINRWNEKQQKVRK